MTQTRVTQRVHYTERRRTLLEWLEQRGGTIKSDQPYVVGEKIAAMWLSHFPDSRTPGNLTGILADIEQDGYIQLRRNRLGSVMAVTLLRRLGVDTIAAVAPPQTMALDATSRPASMPPPLLPRGASNVELHDRMNNLYDRVHAIEVWAKAVSIELGCLPPGGTK